MKRKFLLVSFVMALVLNVNLSAQSLILKESFSGYTTLEDYYMKSPMISVITDYDDLPGTIPEIKPTEDEMRQAKEEDYIVKVYNEDLSLYKSINITNLFPENIYLEDIESEKEGDKRFYLTQTLFNNDDLLEFIILAETYFAIVNENGTVLFKKDIQNRNYIYFSLIEMATKTYLRVTDDSNDTHDYYLIDKNASAVSSPLLQKVYSYPNPAKEYINIAYDLQGKRVGYISVFDMNGNKVAGKKVTDKQKYCYFPTTDMPSGMYIVTVDVAGKQISSEKIIIE